MNNIRLERITEQREVENLVREAFWNVYKPGCIERYLLHVLRDNKDFVSDLNFVMEKEEEFDKQFPPKENLKLPTQIC